MKKVRTEKVRNAIKKSKIEGVRKRALEKIRERTKPEPVEAPLPSPTARSNCPSCGEERNAVENHYCTRPR